MCMRNLEDFAAPRTGGEFNCATNAVICELHRTWASPEAARDRRHSHYGHTELSSRHGKLRQG